MSTKVQANATVSEAEAKVAEAEAEAKVAAAKAEYLLASDEAIKPLLLEYWSSAQTVLTATRNALAALLNSPQQPNGLPTPKQLSLNGVEVQCCKLGREFLESNRLTSYADVADNSETTVDGESLFDSITDLYKSVNETLPFACIIAPSGTGKTQLAATAVAQYKGPSFYFYMGDTQSENSQSFYRPHHSLSNHLKTSLKEIQQKLCSIDGTIWGAGKLTRDFQEVPCNLFRLLAKIFLEEQYEQVTNLSDLKAKLDVTFTRAKPLVFIDEVPRGIDQNSAKHEDFDRVIIFRNILRAIGICPVLMSTHSGAQNALPQQGDSRGDLGKLWCRIIVKLPKFYSRDNLNKWILTTERPLVASWVQEHDSQQRSQNKDYDPNNFKLLSDHINRIKTNLQAAKAGAWTKDPSFQLCQLFCTAKHENSGGGGTHKLVGEHFGSIALEESSTWKGDLSHHEAKLWQGKCKVRMVVPAKEPLLFFALTTWKLSDLDDTSMRLFPLVNIHGKALSVCQALYQCKDFVTPNIDMKNPNAKLNGDHLEVIALASITLATLQLEDSDTLQDGIALSQFLASTHNFMLNCQMTKADIMNEKRKLDTMLSESRFSTIIVPRCLNAGSKCMIWNRHAFTATIGRPPDQNQREGYVDFGEEKLLHIECKNYTKGVNTEVFQNNIIKKMKVSYKISFMFTSKLNGVFTAEHAWDDFLEENCMNPNELCVLMLPEESDPYWLQVQTEGTNFTVLSPTLNTLYLLVVIVVGYVNPEGNA